MFKNLMLYRLPAPWHYTADELAGDLSRQSFTPATSNELLRQGFDAPRGAGLVHVVNGQWLLRLAIEKKSLPSGAINHVLKAKAAELKEVQGFAPGKKAMKELRERVVDELTPRALTIPSHTDVWIDPVNGWLCVDAASPSKADEVVKLLLKCVDRMPLESLRVQKSPVAMMTAWLEMDEAPAGFTIDQDATLQATGASKAAVRYIRHALEPGDVGAHIKAGKSCRSLAMTWDSKISFTLTETLAIKGIKPLDVLTENGHGHDGDERFDGEMTLMTGELNKMLADLVEALGGEARDGMGAAPAQAATPVVTPAPTVNGERLATVPAGTGNDDDVLYDKAVQIVIAHRRASISLVQRHLLIGYNRASRLLDSMESKGVVSAMKSNGDRDILSAV